MPATPEMPTQENSSVRSTFSMSRCEIMLPAVARRSPAMTTPSRHEAATIVVPCGSAAATAAAAGPPESPAPGSSPGAAEARKSLKDEVPALRYAAGRCLSWESETTRFLPVVRLSIWTRPYCAAGGDSGTGAPQRWPPRRGQLRPAGLTWRYSPPFCT